MNEKVADNYISHKKEIKIIDNKINTEKNKIKKIDSIEESFVSLNNNINKCIDLLSASIKGGNVEKKLDAIREESEISYRKSVEDLDAEREEINVNINRLSDERDFLSEKLRRDAEEDTKEDTDK